MPPASHNGTTDSEFVGPWVTLRIGKTKVVQSHIRKESVMKKIRFVGLDVHAETIAVAIAEPERNGEVRSLGSIPNRSESDLIQPGYVYYLFGR